MSANGSVTHWISLLKAGAAVAAQRGRLPRTVQRQLGRIRSLWQQRERP